MQGVVAPSSCSERPLAHAQAASSSLCDGGALLHASYARSVVVVRT